MRFGGGIFFICLFFLFCNKMNWHKMETHFPLQLPVSGLVSTLKREDWKLWVDYYAPYYLLFIFISENALLCRIPGKLLLSGRWGFFWSMHAYCTAFQSTVRASQLFFSFFFFALVSIWLSFSRELQILSSSRLFLLVISCINITNHFRETNLSSCFQSRILNYFERKWYLRRDWI